MDLSSANYEELMEEFPCTFNLQYCARIPIGKFKAKKKMLLDELNNDEDDEEEVIRKKSLLSWVHFNLGETDESTELNHEVVELTHRTNVVSLGNRVFIMWRIGDELEANSSFDALMQLKTRDDFESLLTVARAEQAYCYSRLGGSSFIKMAVKLFTEAVQKQPYKYLWKYGLGLVYRRAVHANIFCSKSAEWNTFECTKSAADLLFDVGENADDKLRGMAYSQLVTLRQKYPPKQYPEYKSVFRGYDIHQLCEEALRFGGENPVVLKQCGNSIKGSDVDKGIDYLSKSAALRENTVTYHYLGIAYTRKATLIATGKYIVRKTHSNSNVRRQLFGQESGSDYRHGGKTRPISSAIRKDRRQGLVHLPPNYSMSCESGGKKTVSECSSSIASSYETSILKGFQALQISEQQPRPQNLNVDRSDLKKSGQNLALAAGPSTCPQKSRHQFRMPGRSSQSMESRRTHTQYHHQGRGTGRGGYQRSLSEGGKRWEKDSLKTFVQSSIKSVPLKNDDESVKEAVKCFKLALKVSHDGNSPAALSLGILYKRCGQINDAIKFCNQVTNNCGLIQGKNTVTEISAYDNIVTVISAYECAGECYFQLSKEKNDAKLQEAGEEKLTRAISLALDLELSKPSLENCANDIWKALRTLETRLEETNSPKKERKQIKLFDLIKDHGRKIKAILELIKLSDAETDDPELIFKLIDSHLQLKQYEDALAFLKMMQVKPREVDLWKSDRMAELKIKVLLSALSSRLKSSSVSSKSLFQQTFECVYGSCAGSDAEHADDKDTSCEQEKILDVLLIYDDSNDTEAGPSDAARKVRLLQSILAGPLGLVAEENLRRLGTCVQYSP